MTSSRPDVSNKKKQSEYDNLHLWKILLSISGKDFYEYYADRKTYQEIPLLTNDGIVIPKIGLRDALSKKEYINSI